jgi:hypothetical protein
MMEVLAKKPHPQPLPQRERGEKPPVFCLRPFLFREGAASEASGVRFS